MRNEKKKPKLRPKGVKPSSLPSTYRCPVCNTVFYSLSGKCPECGYQVSYNMR